MNARGHPAAQDQATLGPIYLEQASHAPSRLEPPRPDQSHLEQDSRERARLEQVRCVLESVTDPEIPVLTIADLGVLRDVRLDGDVIEVVITPTYSGCPAMGVIAMDIETALADLGPVRVRTVLSPAWTTDWMSADGRRKLLEYGIAPPPTAGRGALFARSDPACPRCGSADTERISAFGSTACKALHRCLRCREPFDAFKCL